jgi:rod shape determining protein RodA
VAFIERRLFFHLDWLLLASVLTIVAMGITMIYSATQATMPKLYVSQIYALLLGLVAMVIALSIDYRTLADKSHWIYALTLGLLVYVMIFGVVRGGARRWIPLGFFNLQPSEFAKLAVALVLAKFFGENRRLQPTGADLMTGAALAIVPLLLIARQPDLGTAVTLVPVYLVVGYVAGLPMRVLGILALAGVLMAPIAWKFALKDYQKSRILMFIDPS